MLQRILLIFSTIFIFFAILFAYTKLIGPLPFSVSSVVTNKSDTFNVTGEGKVEVSPDIAVVNAGVTASGASVKIVQEEINSKINKISASIKELGVSESDIKTTNYNIYPNYDYRETTQKITGYNASTNLQIKARNIDRVNEVIDAATTNGANQVSGVTFEVDDKSKALDEARKLAVADARKKAEQAASTAGFSLGRVINYNESTSEFPPIIMPMVAERASTDTTPTKVEPGSNEISITVTLSYEIR